MDNARRNDFVRFLSEIDQALSEMEAIAENSQADHRGWALDMLVVFKARRQEVEAMLRDE